eukprot:7373201-Pyramimonas_sp.AAC.1
MHGNQPSHLPQKNPKRPVIGFEGALRGAPPDNTLEGPKRASEASQVGSMRLTYTHTHTRTDTHNRTLKYVHKDMARNALWPSIVPTAP